MIIKLWIARKKYGNMCVNENVSTINEKLYYGKNL